LGGYAFSRISGYGHAVSADGAVVVGRGQSASGTEAFIWDAVNGLRALDDVLVNDFGANPTEGTPAYRPLLDLGLAHVTGFEPLPEACAALQAAAGPRETYLPHAVGDGAVHLFHVCRASTMSSVLRPAARTLGVLHGFPEWGEIVRIDSVATRRLDDIGEIVGLDFVKIDVQGAELMVFEHGRTKLAQAVAIQTEVSFLELYDGQPSFAAIDRELRGQGFVPHMWAELHNAGVAPLTVSAAPGQGRNQLLEGDFVYVRDFRYPERMTDEQIKCLALVLHTVYGSIDLAFRLVLLLAERGAVAKDAPDAYFAAMQAELGSRPAG